MHSERYLFIAFLRTKSQMGQTKNQSSEKLKLHQDHRTNKTATIFVSEQLINNKTKLKAVNMQKKLLVIKTTTQTNT